MIRYNYRSQRCRQLFRRRDEHSDEIHPNSMMEEIEGNLKFRRKSRLKTIDESLLGEMRIRKCLRAEYAIRHK